MTTTVATTIPAITPAERSCLFLPVEVFEAATEVSAVDVGSEVADDMGASGGNDSPGLSMYALSRARCCWWLIGVLVLGLIAPTMP
jgi:hypothetical protein